MNIDELPFKLSTITPGKTKGDDGQHRVKVRLDWKAYFKGFCEVHGRFPLVYAGRLLFPDGWTYSMTDYRGPEWPPPDDEGQKDRLIANYWKLRRFAVKRELFYARSSLDDLRRLRDSRSAPLRQIAVYFDREAGKIKSDRSELDVSAHESRVEWLENALTQCDQMLEPIPEEVTDGPDERTAPPETSLVPDETLGSIPVRGVPGPDLAEPADPTGPEHVVDPKAVGQKRRGKRPRPEA